MPPAHSVLWDTRWSEMGHFTHEGGARGRPQSPPAQLLCPLRLQVEQGEHTASAHYLQ